MVYVMSRWIGATPTQCDLCGGSIADVFYDARLPRYRGKWGTICTTCFHLQHCTLGVGHGQRYERRGEKHFVCTAGGRDAYKEEGLYSKDQRPRDVQGSDTSSDSHTDPQGE